jgi:hypothetical protein
VGNLKRVGRPARVFLTHILGKALECRASGLSEIGRLKHRREGAGKPVPRNVGKGSGEANKPMRASVRRVFGPGGIRILAVRKALKPRGIVISWSSEQKNAMSETA